jgi:hypothetical protein
MLTLKNSAVELSTPANHFQITSKSSVYDRKTNRPDARTPKFESSKGFQAAKDLIYLSKSERAKTKGKGLHWFLTGVINRLDKTPDFVRRSSTFNRLFATLPRKHRLHEPRQKAFDECMNLLFEIGDHLTGFVECGCILSISNRLDLTTYGEAVYVGKDNVTGTDREELGKKKPSTKRAFNLLEFLVDMRFIEKESLTCPITGERLPSIIRLTNNYYSAMGITDKKLKSFREYKLKQKRHACMLGIEPEDDYADEIQSRIFHQREQMKSDRITYRRNLRLRQRLKKLTPFEVLQYGRRIVDAMYSPPELLSMGNSLYDTAVETELNNLFKAASLRVPPLIH